MTPGTPFICVSMGKLTRSLDFWWRQPFGFRHDGDGRPVKVREYVHGQMRGGERAEDHQSEGRRQDKQAVARAIG